MSSLAKRILSAVVFLPLFILLLIKGSPFYFFVLVLTAALLGLSEFFSFKADLLSFPIKFLAYVWSFSILFFAYKSNLLFLTASIVFGLIVMLLIQLSRPAQLTEVLDRAGFTCFGVLYVALLFAHLLLLRAIDHGSLWVLMLFTVTWMGDSAAYFSGMKWGKRKLYPEISPNKSVEGFIGGFVGGVIAAALFSVAFFQHIGFLDAILVGLVIGIVGPLGDLIESMLKRSCNVKDSGGLIPGHGGVLDRVDSIIVTAPFLYYFAILRYGV